MEEMRYILLQYPLWELDLEQLHEVVYAAQEAVKDANLKVIAIPECIKWYELSREELLQVRNILDWVLELKGNDTYSEARARIEDSDREI